MNGEWEFYWEQLLTPTDFENKNLTTNYIYAPAGWTTGKNESEKYPIFGYATYRLKIELPENHENIKFKLPAQIYSASKIWINDKLFYTSGIVGATKKEEKAKYVRFEEMFSNDIEADESNIIIITIQVSNHILGSYYSGLSQPIELGKADKILFTENYKTLFDAAIIGFFLLMGVYHLFLFFYRRDEISTLIFAILSLIFFVRSLATTGILMRFFIDDVGIAFRIHYIPIPLYIALITLFFSKLLPGTVHKFMLKLIIGVSAILFLIIIFSPVYLVCYLNTYLILLIMPSIIYLLVMLFRAILKKEQGAKWAFVGLLVLFLANTNDMLVALDIIKTTYKSNLGFSIYILFQAINIAERFSISFKNNLKLSKTLDYQNKNLEKIVDERTKEVQIQKQEILEKNEELNQINDDVTNKNAILSQQKEEIQAQSEELIATSEALEIQNTKLEFQHEQITSSVRYALSIQQAMLPFHDRMNKHLDVFVLFRPKDIVSGDFYWYMHLPATNKYDEKIFIVAVDCTGHGVPGAFMSMIGTQILNKIVNEDKITDPAEILLQLHKGVVYALKQEKTNNVDGMDVCLCKIEERKEEKIITFAGAKRPLYYFEKEKNELTKLKGDRKTIGGKIGRNQITSFTNQEIILQKNDLIYLTTDGYIDQNNKERKRFGSKNLEELINNISNKTLEEQKQILENKLDNWKIGTEQRDDITILGIRL